MAGLRTNLTGRPVVPRGRCTAGKWPPTGLQGLPKGQRPPPNAWRSLNGLVVLGKRTTGYRLVARCGHLAPKDRRPKAYGRKGCAQKACHQRTRLAFSKISVVPGTEYLCSRIAQIDYYRSPSFASVNPLQRNSWFTVVMA